jgi:hypothetical protein
MDFGSVPKIPTTPGVKTSNPAAIAAVQGGDGARAGKPAPTVLDPSRTVTQVAQSEAVRLDMNPGAEERAALDAAMKRVLARRTDIDEATRAVVTRKVDTESGEVVEQVPAESLLKLRAYLRGVEPSR